MTGHEGEAMRRLLGRIRRVRFRFRTMLAVVAGAAVILMAATRWIPYVLWRIRLERAIVAKVLDDPHINNLLMSNPSFQLFHGLDGRELGDLRRDPGLVVDRLLRAIGEGDEGRRKRALHSLGIYLDEVEGPELPRRFVDRGVALLATGTLLIGVETDLASAVAGRARSVGMGAADRAAFRERARVVLRSTLPHPDYAKVWAWSLAQLGGREEMEIIRGAWDRLDRYGQSKLLQTLGGPSGAGSSPFAPPPGGFEGAADVLACQPNSRGADHP